jgi:hypothetical protein
VDFDYVAMKYLTFVFRRALATHVKHVGQHETVYQGWKRIKRKMKLCRRIVSWMAVKR